jgi:cytochrome c-type biogenesis protein CcmF
VRGVLGVLGIALGTSVSALGIVVLLAGVVKHDDRLLRRGRWFLFGVLAAAVIAVGAMEWALITHDFSLRYVADNNARATPMLFTITGLWAALEGSILLWALILGGYLSFVAYKFRKRATDPLVAWAEITGLVVALFFFALMLGPANPFRAVTGTVPIDGQGPNPLLQNNPIMAFHPPMLYLGYVGMTVPFMFAIAGLVTGRFGEGWLTETRRSTLIAWGFLTAGIALGAWWSYEVLGWGGYWAWDPVENASLLPWLTATAFIHSVIVQERRGMLRVWNLSLVVATFCLTILGTFLTRSGIVNSVHAFSISLIGPWLLAFLGVCCVVGVGLIAWRGDQLRAPGRIDSPVSREAAFLANNLFFAGFAFVVLLGTCFPLVAEAFQGKQLSVGGPYFDRMTTPIGLALLFLMAVAPALPWRATSGEVVRSRMLFPAWFGGLCIVLALFIGARGLFPVAAFGLAGFAFGGIFRQFWVGARARRTTTGEAFPVAWFRIIRGNPRLYGGLIVHAGVVLLAVGLAASQSYGERHELRLSRGESAVVAGYKVTYLGRDQITTDQKTEIDARVRLQRGSTDYGVFKPSISSFPNSSEGVGTPSVHTGLFQDVYLTVVSSPQASKTVTIAVAVNPMMLWLWSGAVLMALGTVVALTPRSRRVVGRGPVERPAVGAPPDPDGGEDAVSGPADVAVAGEEVPV